MTHQEAPYEIASDPRALPVGGYLYFDGKKYLKPTLTPEMLDKVVHSIASNLHICLGDCKGLKRVWHIVRNKHD